MNDKNKKIAMVTGACGGIGSVVSKDLSAKGYQVIGGGKLFHGDHFKEKVKGRGFDQYFPSKTQDLPSVES